MIQIFSCFVLKICSNLKNLYSQISENMPGSSHHSSSFLTMHATANCQNEFPNETSLNTSFSWLEDSLSARMLLLPHKNLHEGKKLPWTDFRRWRKIPGGAISPDAQIQPRGLEWGVSSVCEGTNSSSNGKGQKNIFTASRIKKSLVL